MVVRLGHFIIHIMKYLWSLLLALFLLPSFVLAKSDSTCFKYDVAATYGIDCKLGLTFKEMANILGVHVEITRNWYGGGLSFYSYNNRYTYNTTDPFLPDDYLDRYVYAPIKELEAGYIVGLNGLLIPLRSKYVDLTMSIGFEFQNVSHLHVFEWSDTEVWSDGRIYANVRHGHTLWTGISGRFGLMADVRIFERVSARFYASTSTAGSMKVENRSCYIDPWLSFGVGLKFNFNK